jgi:superfamily II DNA or RNA helicase
MVQIQKLDESTLKINCEMDVARTIQDHFCFFAENFRWTPSFRQGRWDGKIRLFDLRSSTLPIGCFYTLLKLLKSLNYSYTIDPSLKPDPIFKDVDEVWIKKFLKDKFKSELDLRYYQVEAILRSLKYGKCINLLPTASGKSFVQFCVMEIIRHFYPDTKTLLIVPSINLVEQMRYDLNDYAKNIEGYDKQLQMIYGTVSNRDGSRSIQISTWQSLTKMPKEYFQQFNTILVDECHLSNAKELNRIITLCNQSKFKIGVSGSLSDSKVSESQLEALLGPIKKIVETKTLIAEGTLSQFEIMTLILNYNKDDKKEFKAHLKQYCGLDENGKINKRKIYPGETEWVRENKKRTQFVINLTKKLQGNTLVLFKNVEYGKMLYEKLRETEDNVYFVAGEVNGNEREKIRLAISGHANSIVVASLQIFSTGINITSLKNLLISQPFKSKIKVIQSIGRILRKHEGKEKAILYDVVDNITGNNFGIKYALERSEIYDKEGFSVKSREINI